MALLSGNRVLERLKAGEIVVADGGMGSELIRRGVPPERTLTANWECPEAVRSIHQSYLAIGAQALKTNTFGVGDPVSWLRYVRVGVRLALEAAHSSEREIAVLLSFTPGVLKARYSDLDALLEESEIPPVMLLIETCLSLREAVGAVQTMRRFTGPIVVTCHFRA